MLKFVKDSGDMLIIVTCTCRYISIMGFPVDYRTHDHAVCIHRAWSTCSSCTRSPCSFLNCFLVVDQLHVEVTFISLVRLQK